jgi:hypothetical protein
MLTLAAALAGCQEYQLSRHNEPEVPVDESEAPPPEEEAGAPGEPIADAGPDQQTQPLQVVQLDASQSYDPDGLEIVQVEWTLISAPAGSTSELSSSTAPRPELFVDLAGEYVFELTVMNEKGVWDSTPDKVRIEATPLDGFYVELSWDSTPDLDIHLLRSGSALFSQGDCSYCNMSPNWGVAGTADNPSLDWDAIDGFGPETITIDAPAADTYTVGVHYYGEGGFPSCTGGCAPATATVNIYISGVLAASFQQNFGQQGQIWQVASIDWPSGQVTEIADLGTTNLTTCF